MVSCVQVVKTAVVSSVAGKLLESVVHDIERLRRGATAVDDRPKHAFGRPAVAKSPPARRLQPPTSVD